MQRGPQFQEEGGFKADEKSAASLAIRPLPTLSSRDRSKIVRSGRTQERLPPQRLRRGSPRWVPPGKRRRDAPSVDHLLVGRAGHGREVEPVVICGLRVARRRPTPKKLPKIPSQVFARAKECPGAALVSYRCM